MIVGVRLTDNLLEDPDPHKKKEVRASHPSNSAPDLTPHTQAQSAQEV